MAEGVQTVRAAIVCIFALNQCVNEQHYFKIGSVTHWKHNCGLCSLFMVFVWTLAEVSCLSCSRLTGFLGREEAEDEAMNSYFEDLFRPE